MSEKRFFGFGEFGAWVRDQITGVMDALNLKADKTSVHTKQEALETFLAIAGKAVDSSLLDGETKAQIILEAIAAANLDTKLDVTARTEFATAAQGLLADTAVQPDILQAALNTKLNASGYTAGDVLAKLLTVDGPNSGLNADVLDGKQLATIEAEYKAFTSAAVAALVDSSPDALNTLNELATALGNDPNFATTITNQLASKVDKTDTRLTDAREWSAITITQSEAETGTATTRRAWTAQRVRQAIAAWWAGSADKAKLDGIAAGAQVNVPTNLGYTTGATAGTVTSSTGTNASLPVATTAAAGLLSAADKVKLDGIAAGATANSTDATLLNRSNHTGTQSISTVSGLQTALDSKLGSAAQAVDSAKLEGSTKAQVVAEARNGLATTAQVAAKLDATANAVSATKLQTARTINGVAFDGSANITVADATKLPLAGGSMTGPILFAGNGSGNGIQAGNGDNASSTINNLKLTSWFGIGFGPSVSGQPVPLGEYSHWMNTRNGDMGIRGSFTASGIVTAAQFNGSGAGLTSLNANNLASGTIPDARLSGTYTGVNISGNAATATKLQNARTINGVAFDGSANITIADSTKLPLAGGSLSGALKVVVDTAGSNYADGQLELRNSDAGHVSMGFHRGGYSACQLRHSGNGLILSGTSQTTAADLYVYGNVTAYSDERLKTDIETIPEALAKVEQMNGVTFAKTNEEEARRHTGVIAQEVLAVLPEAVHMGDDGFYSVAYGNLVGLLVEAIKELNHKVDKQAREIAELRAL